MRRRRGMTLVEVVMAAVVMSAVFLGAMTLFAFGVQSTQKTDTDLTLNQSNANGIRRVVETIREATSADIVDNGYRITYTLPRLSSSADPATGEREYLIPLESDGVARSYVVRAGSLIDETTNRVLVENILSTDPEKDSTQYGQPYAPFQATTIGSRRAITVNLIVASNVSDGQRFVRMKTTVLLRNSQ